MASQKAYKILGEHSILQPLLSLNHLWVVLNFHQVYLEHSLRSS